MLDMNILFNRNIKNSEIDDTSSTGYNADTHAYIMTNENLRFAMKFMPKNCERALTVAASGDHPLWCSLYGAKHVDTFDITYNAKCIMDIKTVALSCLNLDEYEFLLRELYYRSNYNLRDLYCCRLRNHDCLWGGSGMFERKIAYKLPPEDLKYIRKNRKYNLFGSGDIDKYRLPNVLEYENLQKIVKEPYKFFHTDIKFLSYELTESYDFMHLSNIFEHMKITPNQQEHIIISLMEHVNVGGRILFQYLISAPWQRPPVPEHLCRTHGDSDWRFIRGDMITILERCR